MQLCKTTVELNCGHLKVICIHVGDIYTMNHYVTLHHIKC